DGPADEQDAEPVRLRMLRQLVEHRRSRAVFDGGRDDHQAGVMMPKGDRRVGRGGREDDLVAGARKHASYGGDGRDVVVDEEYGAQHLGAHKSTAWSPGLHRPLPSPPPGRPTWTAP